MSASLVLRTDDESATATLARIEDSLDRLAVWVEGHDYRAYDPGDGQMSYLGSLASGSQRLERLLTAVVLRSPFNIRPALGVKPHISTKGMGYMAWGYLRRLQATGDPLHEARARYCLDWLLEHRSRDYDDLCWGNAFTFTTRAGRIPKGEPTIVWSGLIGQAFVEAFETLGDERYLDAANSVCDWIMKLPREETHDGSCLSYVAFRQVSIHNSNMLGAALLARVGGIKGRSDALDLARNSMKYSCARQNDDGAWFYGEDPKYHWIDSFHTGYNLDSLKRYIDSARNTEFSSCLTRGYAYFKQNFFEADGRTKYFHNRLMPIDIQCAAQGIDTFAHFSAHDLEACDLARVAANWTIDNMQDPAGYFYYRDLGWTKVKTPMFHWGQATMFKALGHLAQKLRRANDFAASGETG